MRSLCLFASYFTQEQLPYYIRVYLQELKRHFSDIVLLGSQQLNAESLDFLKEAGIAYELEKNEGFDFGLWYKALQRTDLADYDRLVLVNDSCILFAPLDDFMTWSKTNTADVQGMTYSEAIAPHLQSYFLIINKRAMSAVKLFFDSHKLVHSMTEVIRTYEVGMSTYLVHNGFSIAAYMSKEGSEGEFSPYYSHVKLHLGQGIPLIKKKILFASYRKDELLTLARMDFNIDAANYVEYIKALKRPLILSFDKLYDPKPAGLGGFQRLKYRALRQLIRLYRKFK